MRCSTCCNLNVSDMILDLRGFLKRSAAIMLLRIGIIGSSLATDCLVTEKLLNTGIIPRYDKPSLGPKSPEPNSLLAIGLLAIGYWQ